MVSSTKMNTLLSSKSAEDSFQALEEMMNPDEKKNAEEQSDSITTDKSARIYAALTEEQVTAVLREFKNLQRKGLAGPVPKTLQQ